MAGTQLYAGLHRSAHISTAWHSHHSHPSPKSPSTKSRDHQGIGGLERTSLQHLLLNWWPPSTFAYAQNCIDIPTPATSICSNHDQQPINHAGICGEIKNNIKCSTWWTAIFAPASNEHKGMPNTAKTYTATSNSNSCHQHPQQLWSTAHQSCCHLPQDQKQYQMHCTMGSYLCSCFEWTWGIHTTTSNDGNNDAVTIGHHQWWQHHYPHLLLTHHPWWNQQPTA